MSRSVHEILESAFNEIGHCHNLTVDKVRFQYQEMATLSGKESGVLFLKAEVDCTTLAKIKEQTK